MQLLRKLLNRLCSIWVGFLVTICSWSYCATIFTGVMGNKLNLYILRYMNTSWMQLLKKLLDRFCSNFVGLLVTICSWSYCATILIRHVLQELLDLVEFCIYYTARTHWRHLIFSAFLACWTWPFFVTLSCGWYSLCVICKWKCIEPIFFSDSY